MPAWRRLPRRRLRSLLSWRMGLSEEGKARFKEIQNRRVVEFRDLRRVAKAGKNAKGGHKG